MWDCVCAYPSLKVKNERIRVARQRFERHFAVIGQLANWGLVISVG